MLSCYGTNHFGSPELNIGSWRCPDQDPVAAGRSTRSVQAKARGKKKDPIFVDGVRPHPMYVDYKDLELLKKLTNRQGKIIGRRRLHRCQPARRDRRRQAGRFMALMPYVGE